jgi:hypothetical protein
MPVHNADIAAVFDEIADLLEISGRERLSYTRIAMPRARSESSRATSRR